MVGWHSNYAFTNRHRFTILEKIRSKVQKSIILINLKSVAYSTSRNAQHSSVRAPPYNTNLYYNMPHATLYIFPNTMRWRNRQVVENLWRTI